MLVKLCHPALFMLSNAISQLLNMVFYGGAVFMSPRTLPVCLKVLISAGIREVFMKPLVNSAKA
jgi:hypothetical protein